MVKWFHEGFASKDTALHKQNTDNIDSIINEAPIEELKKIGGDRVVKKIVGMFIERVPKVISELQDVHKQDDRETFHGLVHSLKSSAATVGAMRVSNVAEELEEITRNKTYEFNDLREKLDRLKFELNAAKKGT